MSVSKNKKKKIKLFKMRVWAETSKHKRQFYFMTFGEFFHRCNKYDKRCKWAYIMHIKRRGC